MKKLLCTLTVVVSVVASASQAYACDSGGYNSNMGPWSNRPGVDSDNNNNNNDEPTESDIAAYDILSQYKDIVIYVDSDDSVYKFEDFIRSALSNEDYMSYEVSNIKILKIKKTFVVNFGRSKLNLELKYGIRQNVANYLKEKTDLEFIDNETVDLGELDVGIKYKNFYSKLIDEYNFPKFISEKWYNKQLSYDKDYKYLNRVYFNFDRISDDYNPINNNWLEQYKNSFTGEIRVTFKPEKRIDLLLDSDLKFTSRDLTSEQIYNHYINKKGFKEIYNKYNIDKHGFVIDDSDYALKISYKNDFLGEYSTKQNSYDTVDLSTGISREIFNDSGIIANNLTVWRKKIMDEIKELSQDNEQVIESLLDINIDEAQRKFSIKLKNNQEEAFSKYKKSAEGKLTGPLNANDYIKNTYIGPIEKAQVLGDSYDYKDDIASYLSKLNGFKINSNNIIIDRDTSAINTHRMVVRFVKPSGLYNAKDDYLLGQKVITFDWYDTKSDKVNDTDFSITKSETNHLSGAITLDNNKEDILLNQQNKKPFDALRIYRQSTQKYVDIDLYAKLNVESLEIYNLYKLDTNLLLASTSNGLYKISLSFDEGIKECQAIDLNGLKLNIKKDEIDKVKMVNNKLIIQYAGNLYLFQDFKFKSLISTVSDDIWVSSFEFVDNKLVYATIDSQIFYYDMLKDSTTAIKDVDLGFNSNELKVQFLIKNEDIYIFTNGVSDKIEKRWSMYKYSITSNKASIKYTLSGFGIDYDINSIDYDFKGNIYIVIKSYYRNDLFYRKKSIVIHENDSSKDWEGKGRLIIDNWNWDIDNYEYQIKKGVRFVDSYTEYKDGVYKIKQRLIFECIHEYVLKTTEFSFNIKS
ncbi:hypothetical protein SHELI_v1c08350 [Spiroplasma helicoides]|uniref:Uncharacterized protein n=1 Tax=Spiroplasma helicoides TaxID=216938 RepID=A0A1B3SLH7_9MOLU|nr:hypothetical protein [Spiroplasma helicoides]AOG60784.1 hypothetical protein SHELI_v1c08350 [Spiroplasma helicoides]